ncbi:uncharacterized protein MONBRDRAFT_8624 [Monosiga brevicollis MX1]|uniref:Uncharacterized protein n=1 Tax=Monosiga brevicollis TaxID=81824 RepID=A9V0L4_MONBE|nr:uncharacterized protein MONBRDRAFT_8624 [Monosiga brevicollis MX1]EDQ89037.1 predicted protein [Monosiga brevicollis MX1]|eukprot:XP_001746142.1 hypothetical protein [Monosiga brevicollis MX1]
MAQSRQQAFERVRMIKPRQEGLTSGQARGSKTAATQGATCSEPGVVWRGADWEAMLCARTERGRTVDFAGGTVEDLADHGPRGTVAAVKVELFANVETLHQTLDKRLRSQQQAARGKLHTAVSPSTAPAPESTREDQQPQREPAQQRAPERTSSTRSPEYQRTKEHQRAPAGTSGHQSISALEGTRESSEGTSGHQSISALEGTRESSEHDRNGHVGCWCFWRQRPCGVGGCYEESNCTCAHAFPVVLGLHASLPPGNRTDRMTDFPDDFDEDDVT